MAQKKEAAAMKVQNDAKKRAELQADKQKRSRSAQAIKALNRLSAPVAKLKTCTEAAEFSSLSVHVQQDVKSALQSTLQAKVAAERHVDGSAQEPDVVALLSNEHVDTCVKNAIKVISMSEGLCKLQAKFQ